MNNSLEKLDQELFQPLEAAESNMVFGGYEGFTHVGLTSHQGSVHDDYVVDGD